MHACTDMYSQAHRLYMCAHTVTHTYIHAHTCTCTCTQGETQKERGGWGGPWLASYHGLLPQARDRTKLDPKADPSKTQHPPHFVIRESKFSLRY